MSSALELVREAYEHYRHGRLEDVLASFDENIAWRSIGPTKRIPWAGDYQGRDAVRQWFATLSEKVAIERFDVQRLIAQDDWVVVLSEVVARVHGVDLPVRFDKCDVLRVSDGKVVEFLEFYDTAAVQKMLQPNALASVSSAEPLAASAL